MKSRFAVLFTIILVLAWQALAPAQVNVSHRLVNNALEVFFLSDFDINKPASGPPIFFIDLINTTPQAQPITLVLGVQSRRYGNLSHGETGEFILAANQMLSISSSDLFSSNSNFRLTRYQVEEDVVGELLQNILSTGRLPTDVYTFQIEVRRQQSPIDQDQFDIRVSNPQKVDLIFPGSPASGSQDDCQEIFTNLPQFRWESDMRRFRVIVAEARPGEDPESALNQSPRFTRLFLIQNGGSPGALAGELGFSDRVEILPSTSFQYPPTGEVLTFRPGRTYYWRVVGIVETSSGPFTIESEIFCFRIARFDRIGAGQTQFEFVLRNFLGSDYDKLFGEGGEFNGFRPTRMFLNDEEISPAELFTRMHKLQGRYSGYRVER